MLVTLIGTASAMAAGILFLAGLFALVQSWKPQKELKAKAEQVAGVVANATESATKAVEGAGDKAKLQEYASLDFKGSLEGVAALATALKDLDQSSRLFTLALAFLAVAAATVGFDAIGTGLAAPTGQ